MSGIKRLKILVEGQTDKPLLKIVDYLLTRVDLDNNYLNEEKSLKNMVDYIKSEAKKQAKNGYCYIEDEVVYEWAVKYFSESDETLGIKKITIPTKPVEIKKEIIPEKETYGQLTLF